VGNRVLRRVVGGYALFVLTEYPVRIAMLIYAYRRGGAAIAGVVALAQLIPAALLAPVFAAVADRHSPVILLSGGYLVQAAAMAATAVAIAGGLPLAAYGAAVVASTAVTATRPAQSTLIPSLTVTPDQLTAANVVVSWVEAAGIAIAGSLTGVLIWAGGVAVVFAVCAAFGGVAALLVARLRVPALAAPPEQETAVAAGLTASMRLAVRQPRLRLLDVASRSLLQRSVPAQSLGRPHSCRAAGRGHPHQAGREGGCVLCGRCGTVGRLPGWAFRAAVRAWCGSRGDRPAAGHTSHGDRHRPLRRHGIRARQGAIPDRGPRPRRHPAASTRHRRRHAGR
jgi:hypothetical protein